MRPAFSVVFLTTLIGAAQGLMLAVFTTELIDQVRGFPSADHSFYIGASVIALILSGLGLLASFFHLGHPERAWRAAAMWRTSWLSREVIALPAFMGGTFCYAAAHYLDLGSSLTLMAGLATAVFALALFVSTGMIYAAIKVLQEWAHPLTIINFILLGCASGATLAAGWASLVEPPLAGAYVTAAITLTALGMLTRFASLRRNATLKRATTLQSAIGVRHPRIVQKTQGAMGGSFNTREFFHGQTDEFLVKVRAAFIGLVFVLPLLMLSLSEAAPLLLATFLLQYTGLLAERWYFFAEANHPQNHYYRGVA